VVRVRGALGGTGSLTVAVLTAPSASYCSRRS
jgi:hypothetical protein